MKKSRTKIILTTIQQYNNTTMEGQFRFYDLHDNIQETYCDVKIDICIMTYHDGRQYYDISYSYNYDEHTCSTYNIPFNNEAINSEVNISNNDIDILEKHKSIRSNPFYYKQSQIGDDAYEGVIVYKNALTDQLVAHLLMPDEELDNVSGHTWYVQYRANIMFMLALMWD